MLTAVLERLSQRQLIESVTVTSLTLHISEPNTNTSPAMYSYLGPITTCVYACVPTHGLKLDHFELSA